MPGLWIGEGCRLAGVGAGTSVDPASLERLISASGEAFDVVLPEPADNLEVLDRYGVDRWHPVWYESVMIYADMALTPAMTDVWESYGIDLDISHARFAVAAYPHPVAECWPIQTDAWHLHLVVLGMIGCDC
jgi:hypothetical protein